METTARINIKFTKDSGRASSTINNVNPAITNVQATGLVDKYKALTENVVEQATKIVSEVFYIAE